MEDGVIHAERFSVATVLTVYGIETRSKNGGGFTITYVATVLTVYGIETFAYHDGSEGGTKNCVATVLTVYGIETRYYEYTAPTVAYSCNSTYRLRY